MDSGIGHVRYRDRYRHRNCDRMASFEVDTDFAESATLRHENNPHFGTCCRYPL
ncbi:hypothetical protein D3OALGA1CA_294 [Olavius algarvensis associated proteobacterium Delta 3]|nr:hypothetical protein D3OALGA1CA_294 [Olavius algarvensis associated proteobacterium Delta 3]